VIKVCNKYGTAPITANLVWYGSVAPTGYEQYIRAFLVKGPDGKSVGFAGSVQYDTAGPYTINPGQCIDIGAYVAIDPAIPSNLANGNTVLGQYQINVVMSPTA